MKNLTCEICGKSRELGRRQCQECYKKIAKERSKKRYEKGIRTRYRKECIICKREYTTTHKHSKAICLECLKIHRKRFKASNTYLFSKKNKRKHRDFAEQILGRKLKSNEHIHHLDNDRCNNHKENLIVITNKDHSIIHREIEYQLSAVFSTKNPENGLLKKFIRFLSLDIIKIKNMKVIKLWEF